MNNRNPSDKYKFQNNTHFPDYRNFVLFQKLADQIEDYLYQTIVKLSKWHEDCLTDEDLRMFDKLIPRPYDPETYDFERIRKEVELIISNIADRCRNLK